MADKQIRVIVDIDTSGKGDAKVKTVLRDIEKETDRINKQTAKSHAETDRVIERSKKALADAQIRENKRVQNDFIRSIEQMRRESEKSANQTKSTFSDTLKGSFFGTLGANAVGFFTSQLAQLPSKVGDILDEAVKVAQSRQNAFKGLESAAAFRGIDENTAKQSVQNLRLVKAGILDITDAATAYKNLIGAGFTDPQAVQVLERFSDAAAFGKQAALSYGEAISRAAEGIKNQNSALVDNVGLTKNLSVILKERGFELEDLSDKTKSQNALLALYNGILQETQGQVGDANKLTQNYTGSTAALNQAYQNLYAAGGDLIIQSPQMLEANKVLTEQINEYTAGVKNADSETGKFARNAIAEYAKMKAGSISLAVSIITAFKLAANSIAAGAAAAIGSVSFVAENIASAIINVFIGIKNSWVDLNNFLLDNAANIPGMSGLIANVPRLQRSEYAGTPNTDAILKVMRDFNAAAEQNTQTLKTLDAEYHKIIGRVANAESKLVITTNPSGMMTKPTDANTKAVNDLTNTIKSGRKERKNFNPDNYRDFRDLKKFTEELGFTVTSTTGGKHNTGSKHYRGMAVDVRTRDKTDAQIQYFMQEARKAGIWVLDERVRPKGQKVWSGPHLHIEDGRRRGIGKGTKTDEGFERFLEQQSDRISSEQQEKIVRASISAYKQLGILPSDELISDWNKILTEEARKAGTLKPALDQTRGEFKGFSVLPNVVSEFAEQRTLSESDLRFSERFTRLKERQNELDERRKDLATEILFATRNYGLSLEEANTDLQIELAILQKRNLAFESANEYARQTNQQIREAGDIEIALSVLRKQNADDQYSEQRWLLASKREQYDLEKEITDLQDKLRNFGINDSLQIQAAHLRDILDLRQRELDAVISINRSQLELDNKMTISNNQIRARVLEHLNQTESLNESIARGITNLYDQAASGLDKLLDKAGIGKVPILGDIIKNQSRNTLTNITRGLLDKFLPPEISEQLNKTGNPLLDENIKQSKHLESIDKKLDGSLGLSTRPRIAGSSIFDLIGGINGGSLSGLGGSAGQPRGVLGDLLGTFGGANSGGQGGFSLKNILGKGGIFGDKGFGNNVGTFGTIGMGAGLLGNLVGGRFGGVLSGAGQGLALGAQIGSIIPGIGTVIGAGIGAAAGALFGLFSGGDKSAKYLKSASQSEFGINVKDKSILKQLRAYGESAYGKVSSLPVAIQTVNLPPSMDLLRAYAESTGQSTKKFDLKALGEESNPLNQFRGKFAGYREFGGDVRAGYSYIVGERRPELFTPTVNGYVSPQVPNTKTNDALTNRLIAMVGALMETVDILTAKITSMSPGAIVAIGTTPEVVGKNYESYVGGGGRRAENLRRGTGNVLPD